MGKVSRSLGLLSGLVFSSGFIFALRKNIESDLNAQQERLKDVEYTLNTSFLSEAKRAEVEDQRPLYREVKEKPYILSLYDESKSHVKEIIVPDVKNKWNERVIDIAKTLSSIHFDFKNWKFQWSY